MKGNSFTQITLFTALRILKNILIFILLKSIDQTEHFFVKCLQHTLPLRNVGKQLQFLNIHIVGLALCSVKRII